MRKKTMISVCVVLAALLLGSGCASSRRMTRMSGGVFGSYSVPKSHAERSESARQIGDYGHGRDENLREIDADVPKINLWPFFFRSNRYFSLLWPLADFDPYGMAVRPFYNHEGDDYSILFPLSSWNPVNRNGWCLLSHWNKNHFLLFPLIYHGFGKDCDWFCYTPFIYHSWDKCSPGWHTPVIRKSFTEFLLGYGGTETRLDAASAPALQNLSRHKNWERFTAELAYRKLPVPVKPQNLDKWLTDQLNALPQFMVRRAGFFPLFHWYRSPEEKSLRLLLLCYGEEKKHSCDYSFLGSLLGEYTGSEKMPCDLNYHWRRWGRGFRAYLLLSRFEKECRYSEEAFQELRTLYWGSPKLAPDSPYVQELLRAIDPSLKLPATVVDGNTLKIFLHDYAEKLDLPVETEYYGGFLPLFNYSFRKNYAQWCTPALLSYYKREQEKRLWWSVPLLSGGYTSPEKEVFTVAGPLVWLSKTIRVPENSDSYLAKPIQNRSTLWAAAGDQIEYTDDYALCGLAYRGRDLFLVEKEGLPPGVAEQLRRKMGSLRSAAADAQKKEQTLARREREANARKTGTDRIAYYEQQIELEKVRREREKLAKERKGLEKGRLEAGMLAAQLKFVLPADFTKDDASLKRAQRALLKQCAETREYRDVGNGIFFRREIFYNGDSKWHCCGILAGGEKRGDYEKTHLLQFLYRHLKQGDSSETLCFPFILMRKNGEESRFSFMWRLFDVGRKNGRAGGYLFFIPYGFRLRE